MRLIARRDARIAVSKSSTLFVRSNRLRSMPEKWLIMAARLEISSGLTIKTLTISSIASSKSSTLSFCLIFDVARYNGKCGWRKRLSDAISIISSKCSGGHSMTAEARFSSDITILFRLTDLYLGLAGSPVILKLFPQVQLVFQSVRRLQIRARNKKYRLKKRKAEGADAIRQSTSLLESGGQSSILFSDWACVNGFQSKNGELGHGPIQARIGPGNLDSASGCCQDLS